MWQDKPTLSPPKWVTEGHGPPIIQVLGRYSAVSGAFIGMRSSDKLVLITARYDGILPRIGVLRQESPPM